MTCSFLQHNQVYSSNSKRNKNIIFTQVLLYKTYIFATLLALQNWSHQNKDVLRGHLLFDTVGWRGHNDLIHEFKFLESFLAAISNEAMTNAIFTFFFTLPWTS